MPKFSAYMKGNDGSVGPPGSSIINGIVSTTNDLPRGGGNKIAYLVGVSNPKKLYVWNASTGEWEDQGTTANKLGAVTASITTTPTGYPSVKVTHSTSNQEDKINFSFTIPDANDAKVNRDGDTMTGGLNIASNTPLNLLRDGDKVIGFKAADGTAQADLFVTESNYRFGFRSFNQHSHPDVFLLPIVDAGITTTTSISYNILTSKNTITVAQGGTGATTAVNALTNLGAVSKSGDTMTGQLFIKQAANSISNTTQMNFAIGRSAKTYIVNNGYSDGTTFTAIVQESLTGAYERFILPSTLSTDSGTYNILTTKDTVTVAQGGTGLDTHTTNAVLVGNDTNAVKNIASKSGAFYATTTNGAPVFGTLPIAQGGTGASTAVNARKAFFGSNLNTTAERLIAISGSYADGGYVSLPLSITLGGTGATSASTALMNLGAVNKTGDTMTGTLTNTFPILLKDVGATVGTAPSKEIWGRPYGFVDKNNNSTGSIRVIYRVSGENQLHLGVINKISSTTSIENAIRLGAKNDGTLSVYVSSKPAWRDALGASNGIWPTSIGGTGGTDSGWMSITPKAENVAYGTIKYRKVGTFVEIVGYGIKLANNLSARSINLATLPSAIRTNLASTNEDVRILLHGSILISENNIYDPINLEIYNNYGLNLTRPSWITEIKTTYTINLHGVYFVG